VRDRLFIGGNMVTPEAEEGIDVISPATEERIGSAPSSTPTDIARAVRAARAAFDEGPWPAL
jgi:betaine-aldehyde dehydrogenase